MGKPLIIFDHILCIHVSVHLCLCLCALAFVRNGSLQHLFMCVIASASFHFGFSSLLVILVSTSFRIHVLGFRVDGSGDLGCKGSGWFVQWRKGLLPPYFSFYGRNVSTTHHLLPFTAFWELWQVEDLFVKLLRLSSSNSSSTANMSKKLHRSIIMPQNLRHKDEGQLSSAVPCPGRTVEYCGALTRTLQSSRNAHFQTVTLVGGACIQLVFTWLWVEVPAIPSNEWHAADLCL